MGLDKDKELVILINLLSRVEPFDALLASQLRVVQILCGLEVGTDSLQPELVAQ